MGPGGPVRARARAYLRGEALRAPSPDRGDNWVSGHCDRDGGTCRRTAVPGPRRRAARVRHRGRAQRHDEGAGRVDHREHRAAQRRPSGRLHASEA